MLYSETDIQSAKKQFLRRVVMMLALAIIPNILALVIMLTVRIEWLSMALGILGGAMAIFYWGLHCSPVYAYLRYLREIVCGRTHEFTGELIEIAQDSIREGVRCKSLFFCDDAGDTQRLCYYDANKYEDGAAETGRRYHVTVHGQSIVAIQPE